MAAKQKVLILVLVLVWCAYYLSFRDPVCHKQTGLGILGCQSRVPVGGRGRGVVSQHLGHGQVALGVARRKAFSGSRKGWQSQGRVERPQWTLV